MVQGSWSGSHSCIQHVCTRSVRTTTHFDAENPLHKTITMRLSLSTVMREIERSSSYRNVADMNRSIDLTNSRRGEEVRQCRCIETSSNSASSFGLAMVDDELR